MPSQFGSFLSSRTIYIRNCFISSSDVILFYWIFILFYFFIFPKDKEYILPFYEISWSNNKLLTIFLWKENIVWKNICAIFSYHIIKEDLRNNHFNWKRMKVKIKNTFNNCFLMKKKLFPYTITYLIIYIYSVHKM